MLSFCRFGAAFGLAILTIVRQSVQSTEERRIRRDSAHVLSWPEQQAAMFKGLQRRTSSSVSRLVGSIGFKVADQDGI